MLLAYGSICMNLVSGAQKKSPSKFKIIIFEIWTKPFYCHLLFVFKEFHLIRWELNMCTYISCTMGFTTHYLEATLISMGLGFKPC